jgi:IS5 family transposase
MGGTSIRWTSSGIRCRRSRRWSISASAQAVERIAPRPEQPRGGRPPYPTEAMIRVLVVKRLHGLSDEQSEFQLLNRRSFRRFSGLDRSRNIPDRTTIWNFENRTGVDGVSALFAELDRQIRAHGLEAHAGQIVDATLVPAPKQHFTKEDIEQLEQNAVPADWKPAKRLLSDNYLVLADKVIDAEQAAEGRRCQLDQKARQITSWLQIHRELGSQAQVRSDLDCRYRQSP